MPGEGTDKADGSDKTTVAQNCQAVAMETSGTPRLFSYGWLDGALTILQSSVMQGRTVKSVTDHAFVFVSHQGN